MRKDKVILVVLSLMFWALPASPVWAAITSGASVNGVASSSHTTSISSTNSSIVFTWTAATSGISGSSIKYEYVVSTATSMDATTFEAQLATAETSTMKRGTLSNITTTTASSLADGTYYFYIRAMDDGGIAGGTGITKSGPYILNSTPALDSTTPIAPTSGAHQSAVTLTLNGTNFMNGATVQLTNGKRTSGSTTVTLSEVALTNVSFKNSGKLEATVPATTPPGVYDIKVTNPVPWSKTATAVGKYTSTNTVPTAVAGGNQTVSLSSGQATVSLSGTTSSDPDGDALSTYTWTLTSMPASAIITSNSVALSTSSSLINATQTVVVKTAGSYTFALVVNDGFEDSAKSTMTLTVNASAGSNNAPIANPGNDVTVAPGSLVTLSGSQSSDPDNDILTSYTWAFVSKPTGSSVSTITQSSPPAATFTPDVKGTYVVSLVVNDGKLASSAKNVTVTANNAPVANAGSAQTVAVGDIVTLDGTASVDADSTDTSLNYLWTQISPASPVVSLSSTTFSKPFFSPTAAGTYVFNLVVNDNLQNSSNTSTVTITVNSRPVANAGANQAKAPSATVTLDGSGSTDAENSPLTYTWTQVSGTSVTLSSATAVKPTFSAPGTVGTLVFSLKVNDGLHESAAAATTNVTINNAPSANAGTDQTVSKAGVITLNGTGSTDKDAGATLTYLWSIKSQPTGSNITLSSTTAAQPTFTPTVKGTYEFSLTVNDGKQDSALPSTVTIIYDVGNAATVTLDVDKSGTSDATDGVLILRHLAGASNIDTGVVLPSTQNNASVKAAIDAAGISFDVDKSGVTDVNDGVLILRRLAGASQVDTGVVLPTGQTNSTVLITIDAIK